MTLEPVIRYVKKNVDEIAILATVSKVEFEDSTDLEQNKFDLQIFQPF